MIHPFHHHRHVFVILLLSFFLIPPALYAKGHPQGEWTAHPPLHIARASASVPSGYTPSQIRHAYGFDQLTADGRRQVIGIVDAFDAPTIAKDLGTFVDTYHLQTMNGTPGQPACTVAKGPHPCFQTVFTQKAAPAADAGWALETSLDVEWAHAAAPMADIVLVETKNAALTNLLAGVDKAVKAKAHVVSMSWGGPEFSAEARYDTHFRKDGVTFLASSGDDGAGQSFPASSPAVLSVGGTSLLLDDAGSPARETAWKGSGGGISAYEAEPAYQSKFGIDTAGKRSGPDISYAADPAHGVSVYDSTPQNGQSGWYSIGGTSAAAPQWAGIIALANQTRATPLSTKLAVSSFVYDAAAIAHTYFRDIKSGKNGPCGSDCKAAAGYDYVTGLGSPIVNTLVPYLQKY